ncbi:hypothetical protein SCHPADRAFT_876391 [Schizopora paradoxa]|uniref:F-box domain-containing protein n=1 Tax=Schizopora paradoxa TaxID=27342 RepID=A0A0H2RIH4_9AGAM|nr:hypothetical protein SCHPADRAFT_876391 [Schizopora paradoxa]
MAVTLRTIPQEVAWRIVLHSDPAILPVLARTSRTLQHEAEARLYAVLELFHGPRARRVCVAVGGCQRIADHVRQFILLNRQPRDIRQQAQALVLDTEEYWQCVRAAIARMRVLDFLQVVDARMAHSWVLAPSSARPIAGQGHGGPVIRRRIRDARLYLACDEDVLCFLEESDIQSLTIADVAEDAPIRPLAPGSLPHLTTFEGPLIVAMQLGNSPLTHLKVPVDTEEALSLLPVTLPELYVFKLRALSLVQVPEEYVLKCLDAISISCPNLRYLSILPLPFDHAQRTRFLQYLNRFTHLRLLEVDISNWNPHPIANFQRIFATELRMAVPTLHYTTFYIEGDRWFWHWSTTNAQQFQRRDARRVQPQQVASTGGGGGGAAGAHKEEEEEMLEDDQAASFVGLEGWSYGRGHNLYANQTSLWKTV